MFMVVVNHLFKTTTLFVMTIIAIIGALCPNSNNVSVGCVVIRSIILLVIIVVGYDKY